MGLREQVLSSDDRKRAPVTIEGWPDGLYVQELSGEDADIFKGDPSHAQIAATVLVDEDGARIFTAADVEALSKKRLSNLRKVVDAALSLNGLIGEESEKNSEATQ